MKIIYHSEKLGAKIFNPMLKIKELEEDCFQYRSTIRNQHSHIDLLYEKINELNEKIERLTIDRSKHFIQST